MEQPIRYISYIINYCLVLVTESNLRYRDVYLYISMSLRITQRAKLFFFWNAIFLFFVYFQVQKIISKKSQMPFQIIPIQNQDLYLLPLVVYLQGEIISCIILLSSLNNCPAVIIDNYFYFLTKSSMAMLKYRYLISHICTYIQMHQHFYVGYIIIYYICGIMCKIQ